LVDEDVPTWLDPLQKHHFKRLAAAARTPKADAPILVILSRNDEIKKRKTRGKAVALDKPNVARRHIPCQEFP
jgi:hypothetical protein